MEAIDDKLDAVFGALADRTRRAILTRLARGPEKVTALAAPFDMSLPAISRHVKILERAGLLRRDVEGRVHHCRMAPESMQPAAKWIEEQRKFWMRQFEAIEQMLQTRLAERVAQLQEKPKKKKG